MFAINVLINGKKVCTAGVGNFGVLTAIVSWVAHEPEKLARWAKMGDTEIESPRLNLHVGGISHERKANVDWPVPDIKVGDELVIQLCERDEVDDPEPSEVQYEEIEIEDQKAQVRRMAKELGWQINEQAN
jgi:hypothetical protein